jgi:hypothetical protein
MTKLRAKRWPWLTIEDVHIMVVLVEAVHDQQWPKEHQKTTLEVKKGN